MNLLLYMAPIAVVFLLPATLIMEDNVVLSQGGNKAKGDKATLDLRTGESDLRATGRIRGQLIPNELKGSKK